MVINPNPFSFKNVKLVAGLGNPGPDYKTTYHNSGFLAIDYLAEKTRAKTISPAPRRHSVAYKTGSLYLIKPNLYMNKSGVAILEISKFLKIQPSQILIIHDDSDLALGAYKFSFGRGGAGHKGVASVISHLKTKKFWRLRLGVRPATKNPARRIPAGEFVLKKIKSTHLKILYSAIGDATVKLMENENP